MKRISKILIFVCVLAVSLNSINAQNYTLPEFTTYQMDNGLTVYLMEQRDVPLISVSAILPAGAIYDGDQAGLAQLTAAALKHGTRSYTKAQVDESLDFIGAGVNAYASKEYAALSSRFAAKDLSTVMPIIEELLRYPVFDKEEFEKEKSRMLVQLERDKESPRSVIGNYFDKQLFGDHVYGNSLSGSINTVSKLTVEDVKKFYATHYLPNNAAISIVGDFDQYEMREMLHLTFASWKKGATEPGNLASNPIQKPKSEKVVLINKDDAKETTYYIGAPGVPRNNKDLVAIQVVNTLFGGRFTSMLNEELRTNSGLTYGARSRFVNYKYGGSFYVSTFTAKETTEQALDLTMEVIDRLHTKGLTEDMLTSAKNYVKGQFPPRYETTGQLSNLLTQMFWYDFDENFINDFESNVDGLTLEKANNIIATYFPKDKFQIIMIGKASEIKPIAEKFGPVTQGEIKD
ncbi:MAG: insulinase family protein [Bacteroidia bacterium]|nr:insulinase family protein [Bacteroidia bacterium]MBT8275853.1 insulinase family protein [Bacteroidia bacterium]NNF31227.1 insulinase family protein [Flavobacteriaceae bacterium]NNJ81952.1 insulinase family protein [Flavobacteriaceae bacterium]